MIKLDERFTEQFSPNEQLVMLRLLLYADENGIALISYRSCAEACGMTLHTFRKTFSHLIEMGVIEKKTNTATNTASNTASTFVIICNYDNYRLVKKKLTHRATHRATHEKEPQKPLLKTMTIEAKRTMQINVNLLDDNGVKIDSDIARVNKSIKRQVVLLSKGSDGSKEYVEEYLECLGVQSDKYKNFVRWLISHTENSFINLDIPTEDEFNYLSEHADGKDVADNMRNLDNNKKYDNKYKSIYLTMRNWLKRDGKWKE